MRTMRFDFPLGALGEARPGLPANAAGGKSDPVMAANSKPWCDGFLEGLARARTAEPMSPADAGDAPATPVDIPDAILRQAVAEALGKSRADPITRGEMATLRTLNPQSGVRQLAGIEWAVNLRQLCATRNDISDLGPLAGMASLEELVLYGGAGRRDFADISPLSSLASLRTLYLAGGEISDLTPLAGLTSLTYLSLYGNAISDLAPLAGLRSLTFLSLIRNEIADVSPLAGLRSLATLDLDHNTVSDVGPLAGLASLERLDLSSNEVDFGTLAGMESLTHLDLSHNGIVALGSSAGLGSLRSLSLDGNAISDVSPLAALSSLTSLSLDDNEISDVAPLAALRSLWVLLLRSNDISDIGPLADLTSLRHLGLSDNRIGELGALAGLKSLTGLWLRGNAISGLAPLAGLSMLTILDLDGNQISDLVPLATLSSLTHLHLNGNAISDLAPLAGLRSLEDLFLDDNAISDLAPLAGLESLSHLSLSRNEIAELRPLGPRPRLHSLYLSHNRLRTLPPGLFVEVGHRYSITSSAGTDRAYGPVRGLTNLTLHGNPGAPFRLTLQPVLVSSPGERPARIAVRLTEGAPLALNVRLETVGGSLAAEVAAVEPGTLRSEGLVVRPAGRGPVVVRVGAVPKLPGGRACADLLADREPCPLLDYTGIQFEAGEPLVPLAKYSDLEEPAEVDLAAVFGELGGSASLAFAVRTSDPTVAAAELTGMVLRIVPLDPGTATVTVTATTADGRTETRVFDITVPSATRLRGWRWKLLERPEDDAMTHLRVPS